ncbi:MAG: NAD(P)/FAD-dependent oxidoreductase [Alphaproteobacteria bacterium]|jgi:3-phenylpropionate/trans-cinnamate dioxygenase ferredoxin reductase subunit
MASKDRIVIIGAGHAGGRAAEAMRAAEYDGEIIMIGDEQYLPYERPPLSKELLSTDDGVEKTFLNGAEFYAENRIETRLSAGVESIDRAAHAVQLIDGDVVAYDRLLIATGGRVRRLSCPGAELSGVHYIRSIDDTLALRPKLSEGVHVVVVGGGFIGLEVAASARQRGARVTVVELADQILARVADPAIGAMVADLHRSKGVNVLTGVSVERLDGNGHVAEVICTDGETIAADLVVAGIGILPNQEIAANAGLDVENGIKVDEFGRSSDADIYAAGDVAFHFNPILGRHVRLESWANAQNGGIAVARNMVGEATPYSEVPWFWSDQYDLNLQVAGVPLSWDRLVVRGDPESGKCVIFYKTGEKVVGATSFNMGREMRFCRKLVETGREIADSDLGDTDQSLRNLLA